MTEPDAILGFPLPKGVLAIDGPIQTAQQLESAERLQRLIDESWALRKVVWAWRKERNLERSLRKLYANLVLGALLAEVIFAGLVLMLLSTGKIALDKWVANVFFAAVFAQIAASAHGILKFLFPSGYVDDSALELIRIQRGMRKVPRPKKRGK